MFVRAVPMKAMEDAILAPQQGRVTRDAKGNATSWWVNKDNKESSEPKRENAW